LNAATMVFMPVPFSLRDAELSTARQFTSPERLS
jgi:hypothetical protein